MSKILVLSTVHHLVDNRIFFKEIESIKKISSDITFAVPHPDKNLKEYNGVKIFPLKVERSILKRLFTLHVEVYKLIKKEKFDFIHFHDPELMLLMSIVKRKINTKVIFDIHENIAPSIKDKYWIPKILRGLITFLYINIEKILIAKVDTLVIAETSYRETYGEKPIEILNYPWVIEKNSTLTKDYSGKLNFVYAGDIMTRKGIWKMMDIFEKFYDELQEPHFDLLGRFVPPELEAEVKDYIKTNGLEDKVTIHGRVPIEEVNRILEDSHIGFSILEPVANYIGSLPTKIFDYMNNKMVVIASDFPLYKKYVDERGTGITINFHEHKNYYNEMLTLMNSPQRLSEMAENGYKEVENEWNWSEQEKKLLKLYETKLSSNTILN